MSIIQWNDSLRTGHPTVDQQHQQLFHLVNQLYDALVTGQGEKVLGSILDTLAAYVVEHFEMEEDLMEAKGYPGLLAHRGRHVGLKTTTLDLINNYKRGGAYISTTLSHFLANWLSQHILQEDLQMIRWLRSI